MSIWQFDFIPFGFLNNNLSRETAKPCYLWFFQNIWRSSSILDISVIFFFLGGGGGFKISKLQKKLISAYNSWYKQRFSFNLFWNRLFNNHIYINTGLFLFEKWCNMKQGMNHLKFPQFNIIKLSYFLTNCSYEKSNN